GHSRARTLRQGPAPLSRGAACRCLPAEEPAQLERSVLLLHDLLLHTGDFSTRRQLLELLRAEGEAGVARASASQRLLEGRRLRWRIRRDVLHVDGRPGADRRVSLPADLPARGAARKEVSLACVSRDVNETV